MLTKFGFSYGSHADRRFCIYTTQGSAAAPEESRFGKCERALVARAAGWLSLGFVGGHAVISLGTVLEDGFPGGGVDVILNSLAGDAIARNLRLLRPFGRMLELGKRDFYENSRIGLRPLRNNISYFGIDADQLLAERPEMARRVFIELMELFTDGSLQPLPHRTFDAGDIAGAFRHMQASRHIGKVVVTVAPDFELEPL